MTITTPELITSLSWDQHRDAWRDARSQSQRGVRHARWFGMVLFTVTAGVAGATSVLVLVDNLRAEKGLSGVLEAGVVLGVPLLLAGLPAALTFLVLDLWPRVRARLAWAREMRGTDPGAWPAWSLFEGPNTSAARRFCEGRLTGAELETVLVLGVASDLVLADVLALGRSLGPDGS